MELRKTGGLPSLYVYGMKGGENIAGKVEETAGGRKGACPQNKRSVPILKPHYEEPNIGIYCGDVLEVLKTFDDESVNTIITSPPYWGLRDYGEDTKTIWDGDPSCEHIWTKEEVRLLHKNRQGIGSEQVHSQYKKDLHGFHKQQTGFCSKCGAWYGQLGLEPTLDLYLSHLWQITDELYRVLRKDGIMFWNHGDSYGGNNSRGSSGYRAGLSDTIQREGVFKRPDVLAKSLVFQNYRLVLGMMDIDYRILVEWRVLGRPQGKLEDMLKHPRIQRIVRNSIIWNKLNHMPSSAKDRFTNAYEPVFMFVKSNNPLWYYNVKTGLMADRKPKALEEGVDWDWKEVPDFSKEKEVEGKGSKTQRNVSPENSESGGHYAYGGINSPFSTTKGKVDKLPTKKKKVSYWRALDYWFDLDAVRLPHTSNKYDRARMARARTEYGGKWAQESGGAIKTQRAFVAGDSEGKNPADVWIITTQPFPEAHFATFPEKLVEPMILVGCPQSVCKRCGKARLRITKREVGNQQNGEVDQKRLKGGVLKSGGKPTTSRPLTAIYTQSLSTTRETIGWTDCGCAAGWRQGMVLDPFMGAGAVGAVAKGFGLAFAGIDIKKEYCAMAIKRIKNITPALPLEE